MVRVGHGDGPGAPRPPSTDTRSETISDEPTDRHDPGPEGIIWDGRAWTEARDFALRGPTPVDPAKLPADTTRGEDRWVSFRDVREGRVEGRDDGLGGVIPTSRAEERAAELDDEAMLAGDGVPDDESPEAADRRRRLLERLRGTEPWKEG